jgi:N6-L-threonylcarbamoyladenine synthase
LYDSAIAQPSRALLSHRLHTQAAMHEAYGGVVPELASRDHVRRLVPLLEGALADAGRSRGDIDAIAVTEGPGLVGALLVGTAFAHGLGFALKKPVIGIHHLEGHLLSPLMSADPPAFPFVALLVSGGHTQLMHVAGVGHYTMLGETLDDAAGEAFDKTAKLLGLPYPGGPSLARLAEDGDEAAFALPRPMLHSGDLDFSFSGLKTAAATVARDRGPAMSPAIRADLAASFQRAAVDVRRRSQSALARRPAGSRDEARRQGPLPRTRMVYRQRRDDRAGGCASTRGGCMAIPRFARLRGAAPLGSRGRRSPT